MLGFCYFLRGFLCFFTVLVLDFLPYSFDSPYFHVLLLGLRFLLS